MNLAAELLAEWHDPARAVPCDAGHSLTAQARKLGALIRERRQPTPPVVPVLGWMHRCRVRAEFMRRLSGVSDLVLALAWRDRWTFKAWKRVAVEQERARRLAGPGVGL